MGRPGRRRSPSSLSSDSRSSSSAASSTASSASSSSDSEDGATAALVSGRKGGSSQSSATIVLSFLALLAVVAFCGVGAYFLLKQSSGGADAPLATAGSTTVSDMSTPSGTSGSDGLELDSAGVIGSGATALASEGHVVAGTLKDQFSTGSGETLTAKGSEAGGSGPATVPSSQSPSSGKVSASYAARSTSSTTANQSSAASEALSGDRISTSGTAGSGLASSSTADKTTSASKTVSGHGSSTSSSAALASATGTKSVKKGICFNTTSYVPAFADYVTWTYNWAASSDGLDAGFEYYPMLWGPDQASGFAAAASSAVASGTTDHLLFVNEPDYTGEADLTPSAAASLWTASFEPLATLGAKLVGPAVTNGGAPMGVAWMSEWVANCSGCSIDGLAFHWYDAATNEAYFTEYFTTALSTFPDYEIYITEFWGSGTDDEVTSFLESVIPWMEGQNRIAGYAAFGDFEGRFVDSSGSLTDLGKVYATTV